MVLVAEIALAGKVVIAVIIGIIRIAIGERKKVVIAVITASEKIHFSYYILLHLITSYSSYFRGKKGISGNKTSFFLLMWCHGNLAPAVALLFGLCHTSLSSKSLLVLVCSGCKI